MRPATQPIDDLLRSLKGEKVRFCANPGNAGDALMAHATYDLFREHAIDHVIVPYEMADSHELTAKTVVYGGGGSFNALFEAAGRFVEEYHAACKRLVVLPQTISAHEDLLGSLGENVTLLCRDAVSFEHARRHAKKAHVYAAHDVVFSLDVARTLSGTPAPRWQLPTRRKWMISELEFQWRRWRKERSDRTAGTEGVLNCFRGGLDRPEQIVPPDNIDVSALLARGVYPEVVARSTARRFLQFLEGFETINTNRLHVAIGGAMLGKVVNMYPNRFYKNWAVYEFSLKDRFPRVRWMGSAASVG